MAITVAVMNMIVLKLSRLKSIAHTLQCVDSQAQRAGKLRHTNVSALWIQDIQDREGAQYMKILGTEKPADLMTKYLARDKMDACMQTIGQEVRQGRAESGLDIQGKQ